MQEFLFQNVCNCADHLQSHRWSLYSFWYRFLESQSTLIFCSTSILFMSLFLQHLWEHFDLFLHWWYHSFKSFLSTADIHNELNLVSRTNPDKTFTISLGIRPPICWVPLSRTINLFLKTPLNIVKERLKFFRLVMMSFIQIWDFEVPVNVA